MVALQRASLATATALSWALVQRSKDFGEETEDVRVWRGARIEASPGRNR